MAPRTRGQSIKTLRAQLAALMPDPTGDRLRQKIVNCGVEETVAWELMTREMLDWCTKYVNPPKIAEHVVKVATFENKKLVLIYYDPDSGHPTKFMLVPHPMEVR